MRKKLTLSSTSSSARHRLSLSIPPSPLLRDPREDIDLRLFLFRVVREVQGAQCYLVSLLGVERKRARIMARQVAVSSSLWQFVEYRVYCAVYHSKRWNTEI